MNFENSILNDFFNCCNVPVKLINSELDDLCKVGYVEFTDMIYPIDEIKLNIKRYT